MKTKKLIQEPVSRATQVTSQVASQLVPADGPQVSPTVSPQVTPQAAPLDPAPALTPDLTSALTSALPRAFSRVSSPSLTLALAQPSAAGAFQRFSGLYISPKVEVVEVQNSRLCTWSMEGDIEDWEEVFL